MSQTVLPSVFELVASKCKKSKSLYLEPELKSDRIEIGLKKGNSRVPFVYIRENGKGLEMQYHSELGYNSDFVFELRKSIQDKYSSYNLIMRRGLF